MTTYAVENYESLVDDRLLAGIERVEQHWAGKSLKDVAAEMPQTEYIPVDDERAVELLELRPPDALHDTSREIILGLPYLNSVTPHHYIRAKTLQLLAGPSHSVWVLPNNSRGHTAYTFTGKEKIRLARGDMSPLGEMHTRAFEKLHHDLSGGLGAISLTGYSQGGLTALAMAAVNGSSLNIVNVNADEVPSVGDRKAPELASDFKSSSPAKDFFGAIRDAEIPALSQAMNKFRATRDVLRFLLESKTLEGKLMNEAMTGTVNELVQRSINNGVAVKLGRMAGSTLFDPESITVNSDGLRIVTYEGAPFDRLHGTGDNPYAHAFAADHGINPRNR